MARTHHLHHYSNMKRSLYYFYDDPSVPFTVWKEIKCSVEFLPIILRGKMSFLEELSCTGGWGNLQRHTPSLCCDLYNRNSKQSVNLKSETNVHVRAFEEE